MGNHIQIMVRAFAALESLPKSKAFGIISLLEHLRQFPEMGSPLGHRYPKLKHFRQLLYKRSIRIIYEFDEYESTIYVLAVQDCRQKMPSTRELKRDLSVDE